MYNDRNLCSYLPKKVMDAMFPADLKADLAGMLMVILEKTLYNLDSLVFLEVRGSGNALGH